MCNETQGILVVDKPLGVTSREVVDVVKKHLPKGTKIGHAGTLDPLATGVLILCVGVATRLIEYVQQMEKEYLTDIHLGAVSNTDDGEGTVTPMECATRPSEHEVVNTLSGFVGQIEQVPPAFSAVKKSGQRAYQLARRGKPVKLQARSVRIDAIDMLDYSYPLLKIRVVCGMGTYIRSLARDIGTALGCGGYVETLRRTRIGAFSVDKGCSPSDIEALSDHLRPIGDAVAHLPRVEVTSEEMESLRCGRKITPRRLVNDKIEADVEYAVFRNGELHAVAAPDADGRRLMPKKVLMT